MITTQRFSEPAAVGSPINLKINGSKKVKLEASQSGYQENDDRKNMLSLMKKSNNAGKCYFILGKKVVNFYKKQFIFIYDIFYYFFTW